MKIAINGCFGGFGLSDAAYEKLIEWGVPVREYVDQERDEDTGLWKHQPLNDGNVIFDRELTPIGENRPNDLYHEYKNRGGGLLGRYWETWIDKDRANPLLIRLIEEMGERANGRCASLQIVEIPDGVDYEISEYDGNEHVAEKHRTWR